MSVSEQLEESKLRLLTEVPRPVQHRRWRDAFALVLNATQVGKKLILVTGPAGTGKTLLLRELYRALHNAGLAVKLEGRGDILDRDYARRSGEVILIDEADRLDTTLLTKLHQDTGTLILAGLSLSMAKSLPCTHTIVELGPLVSDEIAPFVAARLTEAGRPSGLFSAGALEYLAFYSRGVPRVLAMLADASLWLADMDEDGRVSIDHVKDAASGRALSDVDALPPETPALITAASLPYTPETPKHPSIAVVEDLQLEAMSLPTRAPASTLQRLPPHWSGRRFTALGASACAAGLLGAVFWWGSGSTSHLPSLVGTFTMGGPARHLNVQADPAAQESRSTPAHAADAAAATGAVDPGIHSAGEAAQTSDPMFDLNGPSQVIPPPASSPDVHMLAEVSPPLVARPLPRVELPRLGHSRPLSLPASATEMVPPILLPPSLSGSALGLGQLSPPPQVAAPIIDAPTPVALPQIELPPSPPAPAEIAGIEVQTQGPSTGNAGEARQHAVALRAAPPKRQAGVSEPEASRRRQAASEVQLASPRTDFSRRTAPAALDERNSSTSQERCRGIVLRTQLGAELGPGDLSFLRNRCRPG